MNRLVASVVAWEISDPPTTPRGVSRSSREGLTSLMSGRHTRELAARDVEHLAVHEVRPGRAQEEHAAGGLLRGARAPDRDQHRRHAAHLVRNAELDLLAADLHRVLV